uniref:Putative secreted protein n=1 Tax=Anopheles darlingi TaxID=43151 RepID=A0A2M4D038_ANODA
MPDTVRMVMMVMVVDLVVVQCRRMDAESTGTTTRSSDTARQRVWMAPCRVVLLRERLLILALLTSDTVATPATFDHLLDPPAALVDDEGKRCEQSGHTDQHGTDDGLLSMIGMCTSE